MSVEAMWRRPVCVGGIVCYAGFISVLPFSDKMLRTYWKVMPWKKNIFFYYFWTPSDENLKKGKELLLHSPCLSVDVAS